MHQKLPLCVHIHCIKKNYVHKPYIKNHLHILKEKFEELNVSYGEITYKTQTNKIRVN